VFVLGSSCKKSTPEQPKPIEEVPMTLTKPANFPDYAYNFTNNQFNPEAFKLGRALFYDGLLSRDGTISCGTCHQQNFAFSHHEHNFSHGIDDKLGKRNAPAIQNMAFQYDFFWDGGVNNLDFFSISPIQNPVEMDERLPNVLAKLRNTTKYPALFEKAFGSTDISTQTFSKALSQFMLALVSANSRYDKYVRNENGGILSANELAGMQIFQSKCASCHSGSLFTDQTYRDNGLPINTFINDQGRFDITGQDTDKLKFKVPSLRNIGFTLPYMHDGRFRTLEEVLEHYSNGVANHANLDNSLKKPDGTRGITLNADEKIKIIAFLNTLNDSEFMAEKRFSETTTTTVK
jgi:cytochrome c peroxidase